VLSEVGSLLIIEQTFKIYKSLTVYDLWNIVVRKFMDYTLKELPIQATVVDEQFVIYVWMPR